MVKQLTTTVFW